MNMNDDSKIQQQRHNATDIWYAGLNAIQPITLINNAVSIDHHTNELIITNIHHQPTTFTLNDYTTLLLIGVGKASLGMAVAINRILQNNNKTHSTKHPIKIKGMVITKHGYINEFKEQHQDNS